MDLGDLQPGIAGGVDLDEVAFAAEHVEEGSKVSHGVP
jgi:hypothetical protein